AAPDRQARMKWMDADGVRRFARSATLLQVQCLELDTTDAAPNEVARVIVGELNRLREEPGPAIRPESKRYPGRSPSESSGAPTMVTFAQARPAHTLAVARAWCTNSRNASVPALDSPMFVVASSGRKSDVSKRERMLRASMTRVAATDGQAGLGLEMAIDKQHPDQSSINAPSLIERTEIAVVV